MPTTPNYGTSNAYPPNQCTWWADERYHELTGVYVPWPSAVDGYSGDAHQWMTAAQLNGWFVSPTPPSVPAIICLQAGVQLADPQYGHVGVVEKVNADGSVETSDLNWGTTAAQRSQVVQVTFQPGPGVSFLWATNSVQQPSGGSGSSGGSGQSGGPGGGQSGLQNGAQTIASAVGPGPGVAADLYALDVALALRNPFDTSGEPLGDIVILGQDTGVPNPIQWLTDVAGNTLQDMMALLVRSIFILVGLFILFKVSSAFIDYQKLVDLGMTAAKVAAAA